jgi:DNA polymerase-4
VRFADFSTITRSQTLPEPTDITDELRRVADAMLCQRLPPGHLPVRLLGMGVSALDDTGQVQGMLFDGKERVRQSQVDSVADQIKARFGTGAIRRGSGLDIGVKPKPN